MKAWLQNIFITAERVTVSPMLAGAAVLLITVFAWSLAQAHGDATGTIENAGIRVITDGATDNEAALFSATPLREQNRFRVYQPLPTNRFVPRTRLTPGSSITD